LQLKSNYLSSIKKLAGQTVWYGASSIFARFLYSLLTPYLTYQLTKEKYGEMALVYSLVPFLNTIYTYGMETAFFRFFQKEHYKKDVYSTGMVSVLSSSILLTILLIAFRNPVAAFIRIPEHSDYILICALIIAVDAITTLPFAKLRSEERPRKFALIRIVTILLNIGLVYFFLSVCPQMQAKKPDSIWSVIYNREFRVGYVLIANLAASVFALLCLW
jgi:O-antigen/teichoic acid export membrane protein